MVAGITPTAGGVTFTGDLDGNFLVFDSKTGELVNKAQTGGALAGGVVTYEIGGRQYVALASGNVSRNAFGALGIPSVVIMALGGGGAPARNRQLQPRQPRRVASCTRRSAPPATARRVTWSRVTS